MANTPNWEVAKDGLPGDLNATNHAAQVDQLLGTHNIVDVYTGAALVSPTGGSPGGATRFTWLSYGSTTDIDQPFTLPGGHTSIARVTIPINPVGNGADVLVSLYPNSAGSPDTTNLLASSLIPASWLNQLSAPNGIANGGPLAQARYNAYWTTGGLKTVTWAPPANGNSAIANSSATTSGNYIFLVGGTDLAGANTTGAAYTIQFTGDGAIALPIPQPTLPQSAYLCGLGATSSSVVVAGGINTQASVSVTVGNVFTASWDQNTGVIGAWSAQTSLPQVLFSPGVATYGNNVYVVGGIGAGVTTLNTVYYANVNNGQITNWTTASNYPLSVAGPIVAAVNGYLIVSGGQTVAGTSNVTSSTYYAKINSDGSLGSWTAGPSMPTGITTSGGNGWDYAVTNESIVVYGGESNGGSIIESIQALTVTSDGPSNVWTITPIASGISIANPVGAFSVGSGKFSVVSPTFTGTYDTFDMVVVPTISVPLVATGLTGGSIYHVVVQQKPAASASDGVQYGVLDGTLPINALKSTRHSGTWTTAQSGYSMPMTVYDNTAGGQPIHTWEDVTSTGSTRDSNIASRTSTTLYNRLSLPIGLCEAVRLPNDACNANPTFTSGVSSWTATNCTFVQSNAQVHGGFSFSGLMTPNGTSASVNVLSELFPVNAGNSLSNPGRFYQVNGWLYSPTGYGHVTLSVNWYDRTSTLISTSSNSISLAAATWTNVVNYFNPPLTAAYAAIAPTETNTPGVTNTLYLSNVYMTAANELTNYLDPVTEINYATAGWPSIGLTQLN